MDMDAEAWRGRAQKAVPLILVAVVAFTVGLWPGSPLVKPSGPDDPFVMYLPDSDSCVTVDGLYGGLYLSSCDEAELWTLEHELIRKHSSDLCLTAVDTNYVVEFESLLAAGSLLAADLGANVSRSAGTELAEDEEELLRASLQVPGSFLGLTNRNTSIRAGPCWDKISEGDDARAELWENSQTWSIDGTNIVKQAYEGMCLMVGPGIFGMDAWTDDARDNTSSKLQWCMHDLSAVLEIRSCSDASQLCGSRGSLREDHSCSCECRPPWSGRFCTEPNASIEGFTCEEAKEIGPSGGFDMAHVWRQVRIHTRFLATLPLAMGWGFLVLGLIMECVMILPTLCLCCILFDRDAPSQSCFALGCLLVLPGFLCVAVPILIGLVVALGLAAFVAYFAYLTVTFPVYAKVFEGQEPYADRAILFCAGEVRFSSYVFVPYCLLVASGFKDAIELAVKMPRLLDQNKVGPMTMPFTNADKIVMQEALSVLTLVGLWLELLFQSPVLAICGTYLLLAQFGEVAMLLRARHDDVEFFKYEFLFAICQDLPQFLLTGALLLFKMQSDVDVTDQYEFYGLATAFTGLLVQVVRAVHGAACPGDLSSAKKLDDAGLEGCRGEEAGTVLLDDEAVGGVER